MCTTINSAIDHSIQTCHLYGFILSSALHVGIRGRCRVALEEGEADAAAAAAAERRRRGDRSRAARGAADRSAGGGARSARVLGHPRARDSDSQQPGPSMHDLRLISGLGRVDRTLISG